VSEPSQILEAEREIESGNFARAHQLLEPLVDSGNARATYLAGTIGKPGESSDEFDKRHVEFVTLAASRGDAEAIYRLGCFFDFGDFGFEIDRKRASALFKKAADLGHARSQWIHACELLWGIGPYDQNVPEGLKYLNRSANGEFEEALETLAQLYERGEFGFERNAKYAADLRKRKAP
jgi:TPR repeat protein